MSSFSWETLLLIAVALAWASKEMVAYIRKRGEKDKDVTHEKITNVDEKVERVNKELNRHKEMVPMTYVQKDDFYREINKIDKKIDDVDSVVRETNAAVNKIAGLLQKE